MTENDRLFVPLSTEPYEWFAVGKKKWELRKYGRQFTRKNVWPGRRVELRRGYANSDQALWGRILTVEHQPSIRAFFDRVPFEEVIPTAGGRAEAISVAEEILGLEPDSPDPVLGFRVTLEQ